MRAEALFFSVLGCAVTALSQVTASNDDVRRYGVGKSAIYVQSSAAAPGLNTYSFEVFVDQKNGGTLTGGNVQANDFTYYFAADDGSLRYSDPDSGAGRTNLISSQASLDALYGNGNYSFTIFGGTESTYSADLDLFGDTYPASLPQITNTSWSGGRLLLNASTANTFSFTSFANMNQTVAPITEFTASAAPAIMDAIVLTLEGTFTGGIVGYEYFTRTPTNSFTLNDTTMIPGNVYTATLGFLKIVDGFEDTDVNSPIAGAQGLAFYSFQTRFEVMAIPEPSTYALLALGLGLVTLPWLRRRFAR
ncbi:PEP-CTERM sorting domain-containing protein [Oleiharenicola lentus]|uniref:PEP-CTERM sorting domain-containing protein n=1 Tax=Oleiharenicola lentus TaxID=2508720 RepID=UPI003F677132